MQGTPAKTEAHRGSSTLRASRAPWGTGAAAASDGRDSDLDLRGATHHRVPWRNSVPSCLMLGRLGDTQAGSQTNQFIFYILFGRLEVPSWLSSSLHIFTYLYIEEYLQSWESTIYTSKPRHFRFCKQPTVYPRSIWIHGIQCRNSKSSQGKFR